MLQDIDVLVFDMQDVGCRIYTFVYTLANCMRAARRLGKKVLVCDRPNPINGASVNGNVLEPEYASFVGQFPLPTRHGLTVGELARLFGHVLPFSRRVTCGVIPARRALTRSVTKTPDQQEMETIQVVST